LSDSQTDDHDLAAQAPFPQASLQRDIAPVPQKMPSETRCKPVVPDYEMLRVIGQGAYGEVWLSRSILGEFRAVKVVWRRDLIGEDRAFGREFDGIKRFEPVSRSHPSQLAILHVGKNEQFGYFYYVMELADDASACNDVTSPRFQENKPAAVTRLPPVAPDSYVPKTLRRVLRDQGALSAEQCLEISLALSGALVHLHEQGLIHRDIKPSNVIFVRGVPKLADIGLVAAVDDTCSFVGTAGYIPPEGPGSPQADVYSLGKVLYEVLSGRDRQEFPALPQDLVPDDGESDSDTLPGKVHGKTGQRTSLIAELNQVVLTACESDSRLRYASARAMYDELALLRAGGSVKGKRTLARRLKVTKNIALVIFLLALVSAGMVFGLRRLNQTRPLSSNPEALKLYQQALIMAEGNSFERDLQAYTNLMKAVKLDPKFVEAYYRMFGLNWSAWADQLPPRSNRMANFRWVAENIRTLRPNSAQYHVVNAGINWVDWHFADAIEEMKLALKLDRKCRADGLYGLMVLRALGDVAGARAEWETAERTTGSDVVTQTQIGTPYYVERNFRRAIEELHKALDLEPTSYVAHDLLARAYEGDKQYDKALDEMKAAQIASDGESSELERRFNGYRSALVEKGARGMWQAMLDDANQSRFPDYYYLASLHARLGEFDAALSLLEEARKDHDGNMTMLLFDHWWDAMRDYPGFKELLARVGYPRVSKAK
jgi:serine/threonine protein kinase